MNTVTTTTTSTVTNNKKRSRSDDDDEISSSNSSRRLDPNAYNDEGDARFTILKKLRKGTMVYKRAEELLTLFDSKIHGTDFYGSLRSFAERDPKSPDYTDDQVKVLMVLHEALVSRLAEGLKWRMMDCRGGLEATADEGVKPQADGSHIPFNVVAEYLEYIRSMERSQYIHMYRCFERGLVDDLIQLYKNLEPAALGPNHVQGCDTLALVKANNTLLKSIRNQIAMRQIVHSKCLLAQVCEYHNHQRRRIDWCHSSSAFLDVVNEKEDV